ncbi:Tetrapyrrole methylase protein [Pseudomonas savastanoi]|uniref:Tetrapyrrole methylase protein n=3 Tax=Pseudomonas syringae group genomosp. 2 TaxID=251698 RepID=A0A3M6A211_PSESS|nr:Tetrapyrrole methylase protein [Pseudomonas savastanoi]
MQLVFLVKVPAHQRTGESVLAINDRQPVVVVHQFVGRVGDSCCFTHGYVVFSSCQNDNVPDFQLQCPVADKNHLRSRVSHDLPQWSGYPMKQILLIGMGAGDPEQITLQAIAALNRADVIFILDKGYVDDELLRLRKALCQRHITHQGYRLVQVQDPRREGDPDVYERGIESWHEQRAALFERLLTDELGADQVGAFLVWGDPSLYDSTMRILDRVLARGRETFEYQVIPGITSVQSLVAQHRIPLNRIGESIHITTGRRLAAAALEQHSNVVVMLDAQCTFERYVGQGLDIYWGAYLGTADEMLVSGRLDDVCEQIKLLRAEARDRRGWIMDTYLLRKPA